MFVVFYTFIYHIYFCWNLYYLTIISFDFIDALERLKKCHKLREKVMYKYNRQLSEVLDQLACCYASLGIVYLGFISLIREDISK